MTKIVAQVALVPNTPHVDFAEITRVAAAIQKQMTRDVSPLWDVDATVSAISNLEQVPLGYWPIIVGGDELPENKLGIHLDEHNQPFTLIRNTTGWSLMASHACIEMAINPFGNHLVVGQSPSQNQGRVLFLFNPCEPCASADNGYTINDILVSDFCTPHYFDSQQMLGTKYDFTGNIKLPGEVLPGGYLSWRNPQDNQYYQLQNVVGTAKIVSLGEISHPRNGLREAIDQNQQTPKIFHQSISRESRRLRAAEDHAWATGQITARLAQDLRRQYQG